MGNPEIIITSDGSHTLYLPDLKESYHSVNGAVSESEHVYLRNGYHFLQNLTDICVLEIGFGTGLNCLLTALDSEKWSKPTRYFALEKNPVDDMLVRQLNYPEQTGKRGRELFRMIHDSPWETDQSLHPFFTLRKIKCDVLDNPLSEVPSVDLVYFDAFGPEKQPEMWTLSLFGKIIQKMNKNAVFVTYCAKGRVRRDLAGTGLRMERLAGAAGKREMLRGIKQI